MVLDAINAEGSLDEFHIISKLHCDACPADIAWYLLILLADDNRAVIS
jgi:hypothetical protein